MPPFFVLMGGLALYRYASFHSPQQENSSAQHANGAVLGPHFVQTTGHSGAGPSIGIISLSGIFTNRVHFEHRRR